jgi:hypothetical protein
MNAIEQRIRSVPDEEVCESAQAAFPGRSDREIIAELTRMIVFVAVCWNDVIEDSQDPYEVLQRHVFAECHELAECFPWPAE